MALPADDSAVGHSFGLEFDGVTITKIQQVEGLKMEQDVIELKENSNEGKYFLRKLPGRPKGGELTLTRGLTADQSFENWVKASRFGQMPQARKGGTIIVFDFIGTPLKRYKLENAWPKSLEIGSLKAGDTSVLTEKLVVTYDHMDVE
jgi:phage tail-like protein